LVITLSVVILHVAVLSVAAPNYKILMNVIQINPETGEIDYEIGRQDDDQGPML